MRRNASASIVVVIGFTLVFSVSAWAAGKAPSSLETDLTEASNADPVCANACAQKLMPCLKECAPLMEKKNTEGFRACSMKCSMEQSPCFEKCKKKSKKH